MRLHRRLALRLAFGLCGPEWDLVCAGAAQAQEAQAAMQAQSAAPVQSPPPLTSPSAAPAYQDRIIGGGSLPADISMGDDSTSDTSGLAHSLQIDGVVSALSSHGGGSDSNVSENGVVVKSQWETASYGDWSLDASARTGGSETGSSEQGQGGVITLRQRGMPFDGDWQADNALGDVEFPRHQPGADSAAFLLAHRPDARPQHGMART